MGRKKTLTHRPVALAIQRGERRGPRPKAGLLGLTQEGEHGGEGRPGAYAVGPQLGKEGIGQWPK
jgi:hypothetical protein